MSTNNNYIQLVDAECIPNSTGREFKLNEPEIGHCSYRDPIYFKFKCKDVMYSVEGMLPIYFPSLVHYNVTLVPNSGNSKYHNNKTYTIHSIQPTSIDNANVDYIFSTLCKLYDKVPLDDTVNANTFKAASIPVQSIQSAWSEFRPTTLDASFTFAQWIKSLRGAAKEKFITSQGPIRYHYQISKLWTEQILNSSILAPYWIVTECSLLLQFYPLSILTSLTFDERQILYQRLTTDLHPHHYFFKPLLIHSVFTAKHFHSPDENGEAEQIESKQEEPKDEIVVHCEFNEDALQRGKYLYPISFIYTLTTTPFIQVKEFLQCRVTITLELLQSLWLFDVMSQDLILSGGNTVHICDPRTHDVAWWCNTNKFKKTRDRFSTCSHICHAFIQFVFPNVKIHREAYSIPSKIVEQLISNKYVVLIRTEEPVTKRPVILLALFYRWNVVHSACQFLVQFNSTDNVPPKDTKPRYIKSIEDKPYSSLDYMQRCTLHDIETKKITIVEGLGGSGKSYVLGFVKGQDAKEITEAEKEQIEEIKEKISELHREGGEDKDQAIDDLIAQMPQRQDATILRFAPFHTQKNILRVTIGEAFTVSWFNQYAIFNSIEYTFSEVHTVIVDEVGVLDEMSAARLFINLHRLIPTLQRIILGGDRYQLRSISGGNVLPDLADCALFARRHLVINHRVDPDARYLYDIIKLINDGNISFVPQSKEKASLLPPCFQLREKNLQLLERGNEMTKQYYDEMADLCLKDPFNTQIICYTNDQCKWINRKIMERAKWLHSLEEEIMGPEPVYTQKKSKIEDNNMTTTKVTNNDFGISIDFDDVDDEDLDPDNFDPENTKPTTVNIKQVPDPESIFKNERVKINMELNIEVPDWLSELCPYLEEKYTLTKNTIGIVRRICTVKNTTNKAIVDHEQTTFLGLRERNILWLQVIHLVSQEKCLPHAGKINPHFHLKDEKEWIPIIWNPSMIKCIEPAYVITAHSIQGNSFNTIMLPLEWGTTCEALVVAIGRARKKFICFNTNERMNIYDSFKTTIFNLEPKRITLFSQLLRNL